jgi:hypothetical protein
MQRAWFHRYSILPGFWPSLGLSMLYLNLIAKPWPLAHAI